MVRNVEGRTFYRAWLGSYDDRQEALALCKALKGVSAAGCAIFIRTTTSLTAYSRPSESMPITSRRRGSAIALNTSEGWALRVTR